MHEASVVQIVTTNISRKELEKDPENRANLEAIDKSILVLALDEMAPQSDTGNLNETIIPVRNPKLGRWRRCQQ